VQGHRARFALNGAPARLFQAGDEVIILSLGHFDEAALATFIQKVVFVDDKNSIPSVETKKAFT
jgi:aspartate 1-decarboxylase